MRFVALSLSFTLAALPALAQNPTTGSQGSNATTKTVAGLPASCVDPRRASPEMGVLIESIRTRPTGGAYNTLGALYAQADRLTCAISAFEAAVHLESQDWQAHYNLALALLRKGDRPRAEQELRTAIQQKPDSETAHFALGALLQDQGKWDAAADEFRTAANIDPNFAPAYVSLAEVLLAQGQTAVAVTTLQDAMTHSSPEASKQLKAELERVNGRGRASLGEVQRLNEQARDLLASGKASAAVDVYRKALQSNPDDPLLHYNLALALDRLGDRSAERHELENALALSANLAPAHNQLGLVSLRDLRKSEAEREFKKALEINPSYSEAQNNLGMLYGQEGKDSEAAALFRQAIQNDPKDPRPRINLGLALARQNMFPQAEEEFRAALEIAPNNVDAWNLLGMLQTKTGRVTDAIESFRRVVALQPDSSDAHLNLGIALLDAYDRGNGLNEFLEASRLDPNSARVYYNLGRFFFQSQKYDQARAPLETALRLQPDYAQALYFLALTERQEGNEERATELFQRAVALQPDNADAQSLLAQNLERMGRTSEAIAHWKMALQTAPDMSQALYQLFRALNRLHDPEAQQFQDRFEALQKRKRIKDRVGMLGNFAIAAAEAQNWPQALQDMKEAIALCGQCEDAAHLHRNLGLMYCRTGNLQDGEKELRMALALNPDDGDAKNAISVLQRLRISNGKETEKSKN
jgi:tetratricopeptide (TPR) repeat protein